MTSNTPRGGRILGSLRIAHGKGIVRVEDRFDTDIADLWSALTDPNVSRAGSARSRATCDTAVRSARISSPADGKGAGA